MKNDYYSLDIYNFFGGPEDGGRMKTNGSLVIRFPYPAELEDLLEASVRLLETQKPTAVPDLRVAVYRRQRDSPNYYFEGWQ